LVVGCVFGKDFYSFTYHVLSMNSVSKVWALTFVVLLLSSLMVLTVGSVNAQKPPKPSVPQFSVKLVANKYSVDEILIEVTIKNQPFTPDPNTDTSGVGGGGFYYAAPDKTSLYYQIQTKGHFDEEYVGFIYREQSDSSYTITSHSTTYILGSKIDVRVRAVAGYDRQYSSRYGMPVGQELVAKAESDWSRPQTITITKESIASAPSQTTALPTNPTTPSDNNQPQLSNQTQSPNFAFPSTVLLWIGTFLFVGVVIAVVMVFLRRHLKTSMYNNNFSFNQNNVFYKKLGYLRL